MKTYSVVAHTTIRWRGLNNHALASVFRQACCTSWWRRRHRDSRSVCQSRCFEEGIGNRDADIDSWLRSCNRANSATNARTRTRVSTFIGAVSRVSGFRRDLILAWNKCGLSATCNHLGRISGHCDHRGEGLGAEDGSD